MSVQASFFCTKSCHQNYLKNQEGQFGWDTDGKGGRSDPNNSLNILVNWLAEGDNYSKWCGDGEKKKGGIIKVQIAQDVANLINTKGVITPRTWQQVKSKIEHIEAQMKQAFEFSTCITGAGKSQSDK